MKLTDFPGALREMAHFGLSPAPVYAVLVIALELIASAMILTGRLRWLGAAALALFTLAATGMALRFWELPVGQERFMAANAFFEHLGLAGGFLLVAWLDLKAPGAQKRRRHDLSDRRDASPLQPPGRQQAIARATARRSVHAQRQMGVCADPGPDGRGATGRPRQEMGCVSEPMLARAGRHWPASIRSWAPMGVAGTGVAGAISTS